MVAVGDRLDPEVGLQRVRGVVDTLDVVVELSVWVVLLLELVDVAERGTWVVVSQWAYCEGLESCGRV